MPCVGKVNPGVTAGLGGRFDITHRISIAPFDPFARKRIRFTLKRRFAMIIVINCVSLKSFFFNLCKLSPLNIIFLIKNANAVTVFRLVLRSIKAPFSFKGKLVLSSTSAKSGISS